MQLVARRAWLAGLIRFGTLVSLTGCNSDVMAPPDVRRADAPKSDPPKGMKPQANFDPRKRLREKAAQADPQ